MSYTALYRKFRPAEFEDVKGQDHIVTTLKIRSDQAGSDMRICSAGRGEPERRRWRKFCRAVNCEHPVDGSPCGECDMCRNIASGAYMNVVEIDAASNNGVDNIRSIREEVEYRPAQDDTRCISSMRYTCFPLELSTPS
mgnify:CR=1 FL=1